MRHEIAFEVKKNIKLHDRAEKVIRGNHTNMHLNCWIIFKTGLEKRKVKITVVRSVCKIWTTLTFERRVCPIGLFLDAGNYKIFSPIKKREGHNAVFTNSFHPSQQRKKKKLRINAAGWVVIFFRENFLFWLNLNWAM